MNREEPLQSYDHFKNLDYRTREKIRPGMKLYGYCNGFFGDSYDEKIIEAYGDRWIVARDEDESILFAVFNGHIFEFDVFTVLKKSPSLFGCVYSDILQGNIVMFGTG